MDFSLIWVILFQYFGYMAFCFMYFSLIWTILAGTNVVHISGIGCTSNVGVKSCWTSLYSSTSHASLSLAASAASTMPSRLRWSTIKTARSRRRDSACRRLCSRVACSYDDVGDIDADQSTDVEVEFDRNLFLPKYSAEYLTEYSAKTE